MNGRYLLDTNVAIRILNGSLDLSLRRQGTGYGEIKARLQTLGRPIPENDLWIAAAALRQGLTLASRDRHFRLVDGLDLEPW